MTRTLDEVIEEWGITLNWNRINKSVERYKRQMHYRNIMWRKIKRAIREAR